MIQLLVLDLDGTLFTTQQQISKRNLAAVLAAQREKGVRVAVASGRSCFILKAVYDALALKQYQGFVIGNNGQELYDFKENKLTKGNKISREACYHVVEVAKKRNLEVFAHNNQVGMFYSPKEGNKYHPERKSENFDEAAGYFTDKQDLDKIGLFFADERDDIYSVAKELRALIQNQAQVLVINANCIELVPTGMDKVLGVDLITELYGWKKEEVLILGDGQNDLQMAKNYPFVAMANALEEVKQAACRLTASNDEDGVALEIEKTILGRKIKC